MQHEINTAAILNAVKQAGDHFLKDYKKKAVPNEKVEFYQQLGAIEEQCLAILQEQLAPEFPDTPWRGNEFDYEEQRKPLDLQEYWLCDTMDGAIQYMQQLPGWTINLVLVRDGKPFVSVIYDPLAGELFHAVAGGGAFLNGEPIQPSSKTDPKMMVAVFEYALPYEEVPGLNRQIGALVGDLLEHFGVVRNYGPHGLQLAYVGAGRIDAFFQQGLDTYNWLPGILIAQEAGAEIRTIGGLPWSWGAESLVAAIPGVTQQFIDVKSTTV